MNKFPFYQTYITQKEAIDKAIDEAIAFAHAKLGSNRMFSLKKLLFLKNKDSNSITFIPAPPVPPNKPNPQYSIEDFNEPMPNKRCLYTDNEYIGNKQNHFINSESQSMYTD